MMLAGAALVCGFAPQPMPEPTPAPTPSPEPSPEPPYMKTALLIIDTQKCFTNGPREGIDDPFDICDPIVAGDTCQRYGSLGVATGQSIVPNINTLRSSKGCLFDEIFLSQDYHPGNHISFASRHFGPAPFAPDGPVPYVGYAIDLHCMKADSGVISDAHCCLVDAEQPACTVDGVNICSVDTDALNPACSGCAGEGMSSCHTMPMNLWTDHCLQSGDSDFATGLEVKETDTILQKGTSMNIDAYSVFMDNAKIHKTALDSMLKELDIKRLFVVGIAYDFCVSWSAQDAADLGYEVYMIEDAAAPISLPVADGITTVDTSKEEMLGKGVKLISMEEAMAMSCPARRQLKDKVEQGLGKTVQLS